MVIFALTAGVPVSIGDLFIAGVVPGILIACSLLLTVYIISRIRGYGLGAGTDSAALGEPPEKMAALRAAVFPLLMPLIVLGGIYGGIFTPTEAAVVAVFYSLLLGLLVFRSLTLVKLMESLLSTLLSPVVILLIISTASVFGWVLTANRIPDMIAQSLIALSDNPYVFLLVVNIFLLVVGMFIETGAAIILIAPILTPVALKMGIDPIHFGIVIIVNLAVGMTTPPVGVNLFVACQVAGLRIEKIMKSMLPFYFILLCNMLLITYLPQLSLWLPSVMK